MHKSMSGLGNLPPAVWRLAASTLANQATVPLSPAQIEGDTLNMCAAACLADAGYRLLESDEKADDFVVFLKNAPSKVVIEDAFSTLGWSREACRQAMFFNDSLSSADRKRGVLELFESFAEASRP